MGEVCGAFFLRPDPAVALQSVAGAPGIDVPDLERSAVAAAAVAAAAVVAAAAAAAAVAPVQGERAPGRVVEEGGSATPCGIDARIIKTTWLSSALYDRD